MLKANSFQRKKRKAVVFAVLYFAFQFFITSNSNAADSLSYSGRLVQTNGAPVAGPVNLLVELSYTNAPNAILCSQSFASVALTNGVFHLKLDLVCTPGPTLADVLTAVPANESAAIRVTDVTHAKAYSFQAMHSMPFANIAGTSKQLVQMGATNNQVLKWNDTTKKWEPGSIAGAGTVTGVSGTLPISVASGSSTPVVSISQANSTTDGYLSSADWNTFNSKQGSIAAGTAAQFYRGDKSWQTLDTGAVSENVANLYFTNARALGVPLAGFTTGAGAIVATDTTLQAFGKTQGQINAINTASANYLIKNSTDSITGVVNVGTIGALNLTYTPTNLTDATNKSYVDNLVSTSAALKVNKAGDTISGALALDGDLKIKGGVNYVTIRGNAASSAYNLILPSSAGSNGNVLQTDGAGNLSWMAPATSAAPSGAAGGDLSGTYPNPTVNNLPESKITNLTTDLAGKVSTTLISGNILVGSAGNVATAVAVSGDATLANTGALTLSNSGVVANTYNSVTVDAKGRVTGGTNPTTLTGYGITDVLVTGVSVTAPITNTGSASVPLIGMPAATTAVDGYLKASDWTIFNNKQAAITSATNLNTGSVTTNLQGGVVVNPYGTAAGNTGEVRLKELAANGATYVALKAPDLLAASVTYTLPSADGSNGQVLTTNSTGGLSWTTVATSGTTLTGDIGGTIGANAIGAGKVTLTHLSAGGTKDGTTYLRGDNTWSTFAADVRSSVLTGLSTATNAVITATDSILVAFGKLQAQVTSLTNNGTNYLVKNGSDTISGTISLTNVITATGAGDIIVNSTPLGMTSAVNKAYADLKLPLTGGTMTGALVNNTSSAGAALAVTQSGGGYAATFMGGNVGIGTSTPGQKFSVAGIIESTTGGVKFPDGTIQTSAAVASGTNNTMISGWPDMIVCTLTNPNYGVIVFIAGNMPLTTDGLYYYLDVSSPTTRGIKFNSSGTFNSYANITTSNCNTSISALYSAGQAFDFAKGPAAQWLQSGSNAYYNAGNVGIGTTTPQVALDVAGGIRPGTSATVTACGLGQANGEGTTRYNYTAHAMEFCDGTTWKALGLAAASPGQVINKTIQKNCTRSVLATSSSLTLESFTVNKKQSNSILLIEGSIAGHGDYSGQMTPGWKLGAGTEVYGQGVMYSSSSSTYGRVFPVMAVMDANTTTGAQTMVFRFFAFNGSTIEKPFMVYNPNSSDDARLAQTCSVYVITEIAQ